MSQPVGTGDNSNGTTTVTAPSGGYTAGSVYTVGDTYMVARQTAAENSSCLMQYRNPAWIAKVSGAGTAIGIGATVYLDSTTTTSVTGDNTSGNAITGTVIKAAADGDTKVLVDLNA